MGAARLVQIIFLAVILAGIGAQANDHDKHGDSCAEFLRRPNNDGEYRLIWSGRDISSQKDIEEYAKLLLSPGGVLDQLGVSRPPQIIQFLSGQELDTIAANGRLPVGHWHDGANILNTGKGDGIIYEMVIFGQKLRHSIYRDDLNPKQQFSIINHVAGHNHFGVHSRWQHVRAAELNQAAYDFDQYLEEIKKANGRSDVSEWYQYLLSLTYAQDIMLGEFNTPEDFNLAGGKNKFHPTANVLQAFVENLPQSMPAWKIEMAKKFERMNRYIPGAARTKIMNEGFATLMQEVIPPHTPFSTFDHAMEYCCLIAGVTRESMQNPYWLGLEAWRNLRSKFNARVEITKLRPIERDRAFIAYATNEVIAKMDDTEFLRIGLDDSWISKRNYALTRPADKNKEWDPNLPPSQDPKLDYQHMIITRDPHRVREGIIRQVTSFLYFQSPRVVLSNLNGGKTNYIGLEVSDEIGRNITIDTKSIVQTLYVMAKLMGRPVSLESSLNVPASDESRVMRVVKTRVRIEVDPVGKVAAYEVFRNDTSLTERLQLNFWQVAKTEGVELNEVSMPILADPLQTELNLFKADLNLAAAEIQDVLPKNSVASIESVVSDLVAGVPSHLLTAVPTAAHAVDEYRNEVSSRAMKALQLAILGQRGLAHNTGGVSVKVLPDIPYFKFDRSSVAEFVKESPAPNADRFHNHLPSLIISDAISKDLPTDVSPIGGEPGRRIWGPNPNKGGQGQGEGKDPGGKEAGKDGQDPSFVNVDLTTYAKALGTLIELPNLRPKNGPTEVVDEVRGDWAARRNGPPKSAIIARKAFAKGLAYYRLNGGLSGKGEDEKSMSAHDLAKVFKKGFSLLDMSKDWAVQSYTPEPSPEVNAQVTLMIDMSGSYTRFVEQTKQMFYDIRAILLSKYKRVEFRFVAFDGIAHVYKDAEEFFKINLGGGTSYDVGLKKVLEVQKEFPESQYDRYVVVAGDMDDINEGNGAVLKSLDEVRKNSQFVASVRMNDKTAPGKALIELELRQLHERDPYVSFVDLAPNNIYEAIMLKKLFKNSK